MAIETPYSKYSKTNFKIAIVVCIVGAIIFAYDGYLSKYEWSLRRSFYEKHVKDGQPDSDMVFNQKAPFVLGALSAGLLAWFWACKNKKLTASENELIIRDYRIAYCVLRIAYFVFRSTYDASRTTHDEKIPYDSIQKIDKTYFSSKGYFTITYKSKTGREVNRKLNARKYDNLAAILDHLVTKIT